MIHQPPPAPPTKFHHNPLSHLLSLHTTAASLNSNNTDHHQNHNQQQHQLHSATSNHHNYHSIENNNHHHNHHQTLDVVNGHQNKSFTIAAILGLKKNVAAAAAVAAMEKVNNGENNNNNSSFNDVMNLSLSQVNGGKFDFRIGQHFNHHNTNNGSNTNSALQSLQQLHQHHAVNGFHVRERQRENSNKKASLKSKRVRTIFTPEQLERLEAEFERQQYMVGPERLYLAHTLQLTEAQVKVWFQNRRIKWRKHHLEITHQRLALLRQHQLPLNADTVSNQNQVDPEITICTDSMDTSESTPDVGDDS